MKHFITCVFFALVAGTFAIQSNKEYTDIANDVLDLEWYNSGIYFAHKGPLDDNSTNGIIPVYQKLSNYSAFYGVFQYNRNKFAAEEAIKMFKTALVSVDTNKLDARLFVKEQLEKIDKRLMQDDITGEQAQSETKALIVILGPTALTVAEVGDMGIALFTTNANFFKQYLCPVNVENPGLLNVLGGKAAKAKNPDIRGDAEVIQFSSMKWIVLGTNSLSSLTENQIKQKITKNAKNLRKAAQKVTKLIKLPEDQADSGVIVIDGHPMTSGDQNVFGINLGCFRICS